MSRERAADRLLDGIVVALVVTLVGFVANAPRAEPEPARRYAIVEAPAALCTSAAIEHRAACLRVARASIMHH